MLGNHQLYRREGAAESDTGDDRIYEKHRCIIGLHSANNDQPQSEGYDRQYHSDFFVQKIAEPTKTEFSKY